MTEYHIIHIITNNYAKKKKIYILLSYTTNRGFPPLTFFKYNNN